MTKAILIYIFVIWIGLLNPHFAEARTKHEILGLRVGMSKDEALSRLQKIGTKDRDERKQQEIWILTNDKHYSYIIIAFDKDHTRVRFVTAKAREGGKRVHYRDVIDIKKARQEGSTNNYKYVLEVPAGGQELGYRVVARGRDKEYLTYFSVEELDKVAPK